MDNRPQETIDTVVIGGGQAGLAVGHALRSHRLPFVILDASARTGDAWRSRWDSLRVFTPARFSGLPGLPLRQPARTYPTKDEIADYLESYAQHFDLPIRHGSRVERLTKRGDGFLVSADGNEIQARNVVVAMSNYQRPKIPPFASELSADITQLHSIQYRNPAQLRDGPVLVVGASDSGCEIALEASRDRETWLSGNPPPEVPFRIDGAFGRFIGVPLVIGVLFHHVMSTSTPVGKRLRPKMLGRPGPNVRVKQRDLASAGVRRVPRTAGVEDGNPRLADGRVLDVANVVWCTGLRPDFSWIDLPVFGDQDREDAKQPEHRRGIVATHPGLYFVGLFFTHSVSSSLLRGVARDAEYVVRDILTRV